MLSSQIINQSPNPIIKIKRLQTKENQTTKKSYDEKTQVAYDILTKHINGDARKEYIKKQGFNYRDVQDIINQCGGDPNKLPKELVYTENKTYIDRIDDILTFSPTDLKSLQSYQFSLSKSDTNGSFSLTFFPETIGMSTLFDQLQILDVVEIYECKAEFSNDNLLLIGGDSANQYLTRHTKPIFVGVIKQKKYVSQMTDSGAVRRLQISGISVAGLVAQFMLNLDTTAMCISDQIVNAEALRKDLTCNLSGKDKPMKDIIKSIWEFFCSVAETNGNIAIKYLIDIFLDSDIFDCDSSTFKFPIANVVLGEQTTDFFSLITGIVPEPLYEKFAYMDFKTGKMRIKLRQVPFSETNDSDSFTHWTDIYNRDLSVKEVKAFDLSQSDTEVYTVFFSYLNGYPVNTDKLMRLIAMEEGKKSTMVKFDKKKYMIYGYRPLIATFNGYDSADVKEDTDTDTALAKTNERLQKWFGKLDDMLSGSITLAMTYDQQPIMPGEVIGFLGGQFYVDGITHSWNYGNGGEINISVSRGGKYDSTGKFSPLGYITDKISLFENSVNVKAGTK